MIVLSVFPHLKCPDGLATAEIPAEAELPALVQPALLFGHALHRCEAAMPAIIHLGTAQKVEHMLRKLPES